MSLNLNGKPTFGAGRVFATGNYANATPARMLVPQSQSVDFKRKNESLFGEKQLPVFVGGGEMTVTGKVEFSASVARIFADLLFGVTGSAGSYAEADKEAGTVPATTSYVVTVANSATFLFDLGVYNVATGAVYTRVASAPVAGASYTVSAGVYTFASGDANANVLISYAYTVASTGETVSLSNQLQGQTGNFQATHVLPWGPQQDMFVFYSCMPSSYSVALKQSGFAPQTLEYDAFTNANDVLGVATFAQPA